MGLKLNKVPIVLTPLELVKPKQIEAKSKFLLPDGWKFEYLNEKLIIFTAADGSQFYSRLQAIEYMIENDVEAEIIYSVWQTLEEEDWKFGLEYVPEGWGVREQSEGKDYLFLTRELEVLVNVDQALDYIENDDAYTGEDYKMLQKWKDNIWVTDEDLPAGWKKTEDDEEEVQFLGPSGTILNGRVALIERLIKDNHSPEEIFKLWGTLDLEGWMSDNKNIPLGWKSKYFPELEQFHYLSPLMQVVKSEADLVQLISDCSLTSPDQKLIVQYLRKWVYSRTKA